MSDNQDNQNNDTSIPRPPRMDYCPPTIENVEELFAQCSEPSDDYYTRTEEIEIYGDDPPSAILTFQKAKFTDKLFANIKKHKYEKPTLIQRVTIPAIQKHRDFIACAETGSGKTAGFLLPIIDLMLVANNYNVPKNGRFVCCPKALILAPTRELAIQIHDDALKFTYHTDIKVSTAYGGTDVGYQIRKMTDTHIISGTVGRIYDFIQSGRLSLSQLEYFVLDEADRMLDMGFMDNVRDIFNSIFEQRKKAGNEERPQILMFSATFPQQIRELAKDFLNNHLLIVVGNCLDGGANKDILQKIIKVNSMEEKQEAICQILLQSRLKTMVFVETKYICNLVAASLIASDISATNISGDRLQKEREIALNDFRSNRKQVLVATSVAARGLDITGVEQVINFDLPSSGEDYIHRIGRTGRVGHKGLAISIYLPCRDYKIRETLIEILKESDQEVPDFLCEPYDGSQYLPSQDDNRNSNSSKYNVFRYEGKQNYENRNGYDRNDRQSKSNSNYNRSESYENSYGKRSYDSNRDSNRGRDSWDNNCDSDLNKSGRGREYVSRTGRGGVSNGFNRNRDFDNDRRGRRNFDRNNSSRDKHYNEVNNFGTCDNSGGDEDNLDNDARSTEDCLTGNFNSQLNLSNQNNRSQSQTISINPIPKSCNDEEDWD